MIVEILTLFPGFFKGPLQETILKRSSEKNVVTFKLRNVRDYAEGKHRVTDEKPYGGGAGMVMRPEPVIKAIEAAREESGACKSWTILLTPSGAKFDQSRAQDLVTVEHLILVCGRYEGFDDRVRQSVDAEVSVGDFVLSGGEVAALVVTDALVRLLPGVLGDPESPKEESFVDGLLEYPHFTRPREFRGLEVPDVLLGGNHAEITRWRRKQSLQRTLDRRPELLATAALSDMDRQLLSEVEAENPTGTLSPRKDG